MNTDATGDWFETYNCILVLSIYVGSNYTHRSRNVQGLNRVDRIIAHLLASGNPNFQTFGVVQELSKELEKLGYMRLERIHDLFQDGIQYENTNLPLRGDGGSHSGMKEG